MSKKIKKVIAMGMTIMVMLLLVACGATKEATKTTEVEQKTEENAEPKETLFVYCGAGLKKPMEKIAEMYEEEKGVQIEYTYAGSAQLISQLELSGQGDVFIIGSEKVYEKAKEKGLVGDYKLVAHHTPAIGVPAGNPKNITSLEDLGNEGVRVILGDKEANAIGKSAVKIIEKNQLESIYDNVIANAATVNEIVTALTAKECDAAIITKDSVFGNKDVELIEIPESQNIDQMIPIGTIVASEKMTVADEFCEFVASEKGKSIFKEFGFEPVSNEQK